MHGHHLIGVLYWLCTAPAAPSDELLAIDVGTAICRVAITAASTVLGHRLLVQLLQHLSVQGRDDRIAPIH